MMKFLILGCNGMAGHTILLYLKEQGYEVDGLARDQSIFANIIGDVSNMDLLREIIRFGDYDVIVNCIGVLNQFAEQHKANAIFLNAFLPHLLADITNQMSSQIIHISTDCVFSGHRGGYTEMDFKDGETFYDRSKALGELDDNKNLTLRNSIIGPDINPAGIGLFNWFMLQNLNINGYVNAIWTGQTTLQLAKTIEVAAKERITGLYNMVPTSSINKYDLLQLFNHYMKNGATTIVPNYNFHSDKSLKRTNFEFNYIVPDYEKMIAELADWINQHKNLYRHYQL